MSKFGIIIWGTKRGQDIFHHSEHLDINDNEIRNTTKDISTVLVYNKPKIDFYSIEFTTQYVVYTLYSTIYDWANRSGYFAITLYLPKRTSSEIDVFKKLKELKSKYDENIDVGCRIKQDREDFQYFIDFAKSNENITGIADSIASPQNNKFAKIFYSEEKDLEEYFSDPYRIPFYKYQEILFIHKDLEFRNDYTLLDDLTSIAPKEKKYKINIKVNLLNNNNQFDDFTLWVYDGEDDINGRKKLYLDDLSEHHYVSVKLNNECHAFDKDDFSTNFKIKDLIDRNILKKEPLNEETLNWSIKAKFNNKLPMELTVVDTVSKNPIEGVEFFNKKTNRKGQVRLHEFDLNEYYNSEFIFKDPRYVETKMVFNSFKYENGVYKYYKELQLKPKESERQIAESSGNNKGKLFSTIVSFCKSINISHIKYLLFVFFAGILIAVGWLIFTPKMKESPLTIKIDSYFKKNPKIGAAQFYKSYIEADSIPEDSIISKYFEKDFLQKLKDIHDQKIKEKNDLIEEEKRKLQAKLVSIQLFADSLKFKSALYSTDSIEGKIIEVNNLYSHDSTLNTDSRILKDEGRDKLIKRLKELKVIVNEEYKIRISKDRKANKKNKLENLFKDYENLSEAQKSYLINYLNSY